ncbi:LacI family DNA-binding transcriptional regulator [Treponema sp.]
MKKPVLKDIAERCGLSVAAVSMILAGKGSISQTVSERVKAVADELGYVRKPQKIDSNRRHFKYVAILQWEDAPLLWSFSHPFVLQLERLLLKEGYTPIVIHKLPELSSETIYKEIKNTKVGVVFSIHYVDPLLFKKIEEDGIPVIVINNSNHQNTFNSVLCDDIQGAYEGAMQLVSLGHTRIAYADYQRPEIPAVVQDRFFGFKRAIDEAGLDFPANHHLNYHDLNLGELQKKIHRLFRSTQRPTAIFIHDDYFAVTILDILSGLGLQIPQDVSIICPGDVLDYSQPYTPRLSTMQIDRTLMASLAWGILRSRIPGSVGHAQVLKTKMHFIDRGSCIAPCL